MKKRLLEILMKFAMFSLASGIGTIVDLGLHWLLSRFVFEGNYVGSYWIAPIISFECAVVTNFLIAFNFVWRERISSRGSRSFWRHFAAYNATSTGVFVIKLAVMQGIHFLFLSLPPVLCNLLALCVSGGINFIMNEWVIFRRPTRGGKGPDLHA